MSRIPRLWSAKRVIVALASGTTVLGASAIAQAGDGPPPLNVEIQILQSGLELLGYYDGLLDGEMQPRTREALEQFAADNDVTDGVDPPTRALFDAMAAAVGPALAVGFGTNPAGTWDIDLSGLSAEEAQEIRDLHQWDSLDLCSSPLAINFQGMAYVYWRYGSPTVFALVDGRLEPVPNLNEPEYPAAPAFSLVDDDTMQRTFNGEIESWHRCE